MMTDDEFKINNIMIEEAKQIVINYIIHYCYYSFFSNNKKC